MLLITYDPLTGVFFQMNPLDFLHSLHDGLHLGYYYWYGSAESEVKLRVFFEHIAVVSDGQTDEH